MSQAAQYHSASLYVGDLEPDVTEALLFEIFNAVGPVASIRVCRDAVTRRSLGYAYVNFHNVADAERALDTMNFSVIKSQPCRIMWSQRDPSLRKSGVGNIFVKNLDTSIDNKALFDTFSLFGNILSCKVATDIEGNSKGYGYVHYETQEAANAAIEKINGMLIAEKQVQVTYFQRRQDRGDSSSFTNCYIKNVPKEWSDEQFRNFFEKAGDITSAVVMRGASGESKGFGFVNFDNADAARTAVEEFNGAKVSDSDEPEMYVGRAQRKAERERELRQKYEQMKLERMNKYQGVNLYVKNLDDTVIDDQLREHFATCGTITSARVMKDATGNSKGFGFVCFSAPEEATKAVSEMNGKLINGKPIYVALAQRRDVRRAQLEAQHAQQRAGVIPGRMPMAQPMYGAAPMFYAAQPIGQMPPQPRQGFVYPQQMMPRVPRGPMPYPRPPAGYQMPAYAIGQQQNRQGGGRRQRQPFKYTSNARNQPQQHREQQLPQQVAQRPQMGGMPGHVEPLNASLLAAASPEQQKNMIGERLYPLIHQAQPEQAGKITGMLLEMDNSELLGLLESPEELDAKVKEAVRVLEDHLAEAN